LLTGLLGVGGGFLLMPALLRFAQLPLRVATGTSLAIIASNSAIGFVAHLSKESPDWMTAWIFCAVAIGGVVAGGKLASHLPDVLLRRTFGILVLMTAAYVLWQR
jgi:uncharacterized membrane protein YfcA